MENDTKIGIVVGVVIIIGIVAAYFYLKSDATTTQPMENDTTSMSNGYSTSTESNNIGQNSQATSTTSTTTEQKNMTHATITTNKGIIEVELATDKPATVSNFQKLASESFYNGVRFHRVIKGFMIQTGDPLSKDLSKKSSWGTGGPGYKFNDELTGKETYTQGTLAMANSGPNTNGSQFFIVTASPSVALPPSYTVFGKVTKGLDVALAIENTKTDADDRPLEDVIISSIVLK